MRNSKWVAVAALTLGTVACGGGGKKINYAKVQTSKRVAIVSVCGLESLVVAKGAQTANMANRQALMDSLAIGFDAALPSAWQGVQVTPFAAVAANPSVPRKQPFARRMCAMGFDPYLPKGYTGDPDKAYWASVAKALDVDAVIGITSNLGFRLAGDGVRLYNGSFNPMYVYMVDKDGELIVTMSMKGLDSAEVPSGSGDAQLLPALGMSYGNVIATEFVRRLKEG